ncbi:unnamed protein product [Adineta steineri]|uniref:Uncharacterized protein n=1 Tax=Adineta steineri TaxID=433720 RepID=A0A819SPW1_9BILA|nr:unnamed protein product [Adineta steineri]CAF4064786.1 unnamed protein product [Adineta steineri]
MSIFESTSNSSLDRAIYISRSTTQIIESVYDKITYGVYSIVLILSVIQTFWKNKRINHVLCSIIEAYSDGKFESHQVCLRQQIVTCYRYDKRFSHIPHPNRIMLFITAIHIQLLMYIAVTTLLIRTTILVSDCKSLQLPLEFLQCQNNQDPCPSNGTETPIQCTYYSFEMTNIITMVTSVISWHYGLRYFAVKLIRFIRWTLFHNNDRPRKLFCCRCRATIRRLRCIMYVDYTILWVYLLTTAVLGFAYNINIYQIPVASFGAAWTPILMTVDRLFTLNTALVPELLQNWLDITANGEVLPILESKGLLLTDVEPLIYLTAKKNETSASTTNKLCHSNIVE